LNPATPLHVLDEVLSDIDLVLIMSVNPGFGGQRYIPHITDKIRRMRALLDERGLGHIHLQVDGGISATNVREVVEAGVTNIVAGSAIFGHSSGIAAAVAEFRRALS
jgi:ribulose-phosphate 3-epimerase